MKKLFVLLAVLFFALISYGQNPATFASGIRLPNSTEETGFTRIPVQDVNGNVTGYINKSDLELALGVPPVDGYVLSSTIAGVRSWIANGTGGGGITWSTPVNANITFTGDQLWNFGGPANQALGIYAATFHGSLEGGAINATTANFSQYIQLFDETDLVPGGWAVNRAPIWFNATDDRIKLILNNATVEELAYSSDLNAYALTADLLGLLPLDGSRAMIGSLDMNGNELEMNNGNINQANGIGNNGILTQGGIANFSNQVTIVGGSGGRIEIEGDSGADPFLDFQYDNGVSIIGRLSVDRTDGGLFWDADTGNSNPIELGVGGGSSSYTAPENFSIGFGTIVLTDLNIHQGAAKTINVMNAANTADINLFDINPTEIDILSFNCDGPGQMEFTSTNGFKSALIGSNNAVRVTTDGAVTFEETGPNTGIYRIYPGDNVTYFTVDLTPPLVTSATVENADPDALVVTFDENVTFTNTTGLSLDGDWTGVGFSSIQSGNGTSTVTFDLDTDIANGETGNFVYSGSNTGVDDNSNALASGSTSVTNNVGGANAYTDANAANATETINQTTGFTAQNNVTLAGTATNPTPTSGTQTVHFTVDTPGLAQVRFDGSGISNTDNVTVTYDVYVAGSGSGNIFCRLNGGQGWDVEQQYNLVPGDRDQWISISQTANATQNTPEIQIQASSGVTGITDIYIDNIVFTIN